MGPWWLAIAGGICTTLLAGMGKLWSELRTARRELADANAQILHAQLEASTRSDEHQREHRQDLRRLAGLSTSFTPAPMSPYPPIVIRAKPAKARITKKPGDL
jgi:hypothetical protein